MSRKQRSKIKVQRSIFFGSGDLAARRAGRFSARTAKQGQSPRYGTHFEISNLRSEISKSNSDQGKSLQSLKSSLRLCKREPQTLPHGQPTALPFTISAQYI